MMNIAQLITPKVCTIFLHETNTVRQGLEVMCRHGYTALPVLSNRGSYLGRVTEGDFLRHMMSIGTTAMKPLEHQLIRDIYRADFCKPLNIRATTREITDALLRQNFVPIVDDRGCFCGLVTRRAYILALSQECGCYCEGAEMRAE